MPQLIIHPSGPLRGSVAVPGDKSISHRALILGALADGDTHVSGWVSAEVCLATLRCIRALGVQVEEVPPPAPQPWREQVHPSPEVGRGAGGEGLLIHGVGLNGLVEPADVLHCAGSGTTIRLLAGLLAGQPFTSVLTGADALRRRPMGRVAEPLRRMGATILGREGGKLAPLTLRGGDLHGIEYIMPVASAQVKSAILLAGLFAGGETVVHEPGPSRDHTERMLRQFGVEVEAEVKTEAKGAAVRLRGGQRLTAGGGPLCIPGDFSSAAFPLVAAAIVPGSHITLTGVGVNPTRTGLYDLLEAMGAELQDEGPMTNDQGASSFVVRRSSAVGEPISNLVIHGSNLRGVEVGGDLVVRAIDEFPIFAVAATQAEGTTTLRDAAELRVKESDRIASVAAELRKMGAWIEERPDGMIIHGPTPLTGAVVDSHGDHRLAMALAVAGLVARGETVVRGAEAINDSFPGFVETMQALGADVTWMVNGE
ncbi:MAG: 3-phosphoshikimate 1-carboxyvinyltransferase [Chloroflexi bacterium]|nr:3-phosphoshikimate 1-carboxyvinyltransferase [Chloroflexota bacterium]